MEVFVKKEMTNNNMRPNQYVAHGLSHFMDAGDHYTRNVLPHSQYLIDQAHAGMTAAQLAQDRHGDGAVGH
jgi:hypothetical protein